MNEAQRTAKRIVLHVGCGAKVPGKLHRRFSPERWAEVRLDIDPQVEPDIVASITDMSMVPDEAYDGLYSSHNLEHLYWHQVPTALGEFYRVLKPGGYLLVTLPDLKQICAEVVAGKSLTAQLYRSPAGPVAAVDVLYGFGAALRRGNHFMAHKCGFTEVDLRDLLIKAGFAPVRVRPDERYNLWAEALKPKR